MCGFNLEVSCSILNSFTRKKCLECNPTFQISFFFNLEITACSSQAEQKRKNHCPTESSSHGIWRRIVPCNKSGCRLSWCTLFVGTDTYVLATTTRKTSKAIFSTARATGTWCIPAFYWSMIMPRAYRVAIHPNEIFQARTPPHHKQPRHTVPNAHGEMHELTRRHDTHNGRRRAPAVQHAWGGARTPRRAHEHGRYEAEEPKHHRPGRTVPSYT